ncbi:hypothetical protein SMICM17S_08486 [Streptomyces microflavus]
MGEDPLTGVVVELAVDQRGEPVPQMRFGRGGTGETCAAHAVPPSPARTASARERCSARASGERCLSALRRCERPRWMRLRTVPSFTPRVAAISS